jgi:hypothetical protein
MEIFRVGAIRQIDCSQQPVIDPSSGRYSKPKVNHGLEISIIVKNLYCFKANIDDPLLVSISIYRYGFGFFGVIASSMRTLFLLRLLVLRDSSQPVKCDCSNHVENTENPRQAEVSPSVSKFDV